MERYHEIPDAINMVLEFAEKKVSFCGPKSEYEKIRDERNSLSEKNREQERADFENNVEEIKQATFMLHTEKVEDEKEALIEMKNVNVGWGDNHVLVDLNWRLNKGEHWLIRGPNGSGKTTFLELITGDNMQVFSNDIKLFGARRGSGETIWDIKRKL